MVLAILAAGGSAWAQTGSVLRIQYNERAPYQVTAANGQVSGLTATPVARALREAGIDHVWEKIPINRQLAAIRAGVEPVCGVGWFQNAERLGYARFSRPIYADKPTVLLANPAFAAGVAPRASLEDILAQPGLRVLVKESYSYGPFIDALLARTPAMQVFTTGENAQMAAMVRLHRADFMFISEEEAPVAAAQGGLADKDWKLLRPSGMPQGEKRYLMCSAAVGEDVLRRFNQALGHPTGHP